MLETRSPLAWDRIYEMAGNRRSVPRSLSFMMTKNQPADTPPRGEYRE
jgi:hypothetical protein